MTHQPTKIQHIVTTALLSLPDLRKVGIGLIVLTLGCGGMYGMFLNQTVLNVVEREGGEKQLAELDMSLSEYEFKYITTTSQVTLDDVLALGYVEDLSPTFVSPSEVTRFTYQR